MDGVGVCDGWMGWECVMDGMGWECVMDGVGVCDGRMEWGGSV